MQVFLLINPHLINLLFKVNQLNLQQLIWDYHCNVVILCKDFFFIIYIRKPIRKKSLQNHICKKKKLKILHTIFIKIFVSFCRESYLKVNCPLPSKVLAGYHTIHLTAWLTCSLSAKTQRCYSQNNPLRVALTGGTNIWVKYCTPSPFQH